MNTVAKTLQKATDDLGTDVETELNTKGRYQICMELAAGGMGTVYLALYRGLDGFERVVALKRMHDHLSSQPRFVEMFFNEAQALARVHNPGVCALIDLGVFQGSHFLAMDYLEGESFAAVYRILEDQPQLARQDQYPRMIARIAARVCDALHAVHETCDENGKPLHLVHCDISPQNMLVLYDGTVRLMDFGVARVRDTLNEDGGSDHGKLPYMAPEQLEGVEPDQRTDIWAMGVVIWEMLTGMALFDGRTMTGIAQEVTKKRVPLASAINPSVPDALAAIVAKALERDRSKRTASARELCLALEGFLSDQGDTVPAGHVSAWLVGLFPGRSGDLRGMRAMARAIGDQLAPPSQSGRPSDRSPSVFPSASPIAQDARSRTIQLSSMPIGATALTTMPSAMPISGPAPDREASVPTDPPQPSAAIVPNRAPLAAIAAVVVVAVLGSAAWLGMSRRSAPAAVVPSTVATHPAPTAPSTPQPPPAAPVVEPAPAAPPPAAAVAAAPQPVPAAPPPATKPAEPAQTIAAKPVAATSPPTAAAPVKPAAPPAQPAAKTPAAAAVATPRKKPAESHVAPPTGSTGSIYVLSSPGPADVYEQGRNLGKTPVRLRLSAGDHALQLRPVSGGKPKIVVVHIDEGANSFASVTMDQ